MSKILHAAGVDPGLVHTGVVHMSMYGNKRQVDVRYAVFDGLDAEGVAEWLPGVTYPVFVEKYRPRQSLSSDERMVQGEAEFRRHLPNATFIENTGVVKIIVPSLLKSLKLWDFPVSTHHQDLRSAARIMMRGLLRDEWANMVISDLVSDQLDGHPWEVRVLEDVA